MFDFLLQSVERTVMYCQILLKLNLIYNSPQVNVIKHYLLFNPFQNKPWFLHVCSTSHLKTLWQKEKLLVTRNFSFSHSVFYPFGELSVIFIKSEIVVCKFFQFGIAKNFIVWERVNLPHHFNTKQSCSNRPSPAGSVVSMSDS